jgi:hypothetical protein
VAEYRAYILGSGGRIMRPVELECPNDDAANTTTVHGKSATTRGGSSVLFKGHPLEKYSEGAESRR